MKKEKKKEEKGEKEKEEKKYERAIRVGTWHGIEPRGVARCALDTESWPSARCHCPTLGYFLDV